MKNLDMNKLIKSLSNINDKKELFSETPGVRNVLLSLTKSSTQNIDLNSFSLNDVWSTYDILDEVIAEQDNIEKVIEQLHFKLSTNSQNQDFI